MLEYFFTLDNVKWRQSIALGCDNDHQLHLLTTLGKLYRRVITYDERTPYWAEPVERIEAEAVALCGKLVLIRTINGISRYDDSTQSLVSWRPVTL